MKLIRLLRAEPRNIQAYHQAAISHLEMEAGDFLINDALTERLLHYYNKIVHSKPNSHLKKGCLLFKILKVLKVHVVSEQKIGNRVYQTVPFRMLTS